MFDTHIWRTMFENGFLSAATIAMIVALINALAG